MLARAARRERKNGMGDGKNLVGVDIGSSSIKVCQVKSTKSGYLLTHLGFVELPNDTIVDGQVKNPSAIVLALKEVFSAAKIRQREVGVSVSAQNVIIRKITVPMMTSAELDEQIRWEAEQHIPFDIKDVHVDYEVLRNVKPSATPSWAARARNKVWSTDFGWIVKLSMADQSSTGTRTLRSMA